MQIKELTVIPKDDGVEIRFPIISFPENRFNALMASIKRNRERGNLFVTELSCNSDNICIIQVRGISDCVPQFMQMIETEILIADLMPQPTPKETKEEILKSLIS